METGYNGVSQQMSQMTKVKPIRVAIQQSQIKFGNTRTNTPIKFSDLCVQIIKCEND